MAVEDAEIFGPILTQKMLWKFVPPFTTEDPADDRVLEQLSSVHMFLRRLFVERFFLLRAERFAILVCRCIGKGAFVYLGRGES